MGEVESTQDVASTLAQGGAPEGSVVVASSQSAGRGRTGRSWISPTGGLYMSLILRPSSNEGVQLLPLLAALAIAEALATTLDLRASVRWPNDVLLAGKKVSGVIAERSTSKGGGPYVVLGVGVNCNSDVEELGDESRVATTLKSASGNEVDLVALRLAVLLAFQKRYSDWASGKFDVEQITKSISTVGLTIEAKLKAQDGVFLLTVVRLAEDGALIVSSDGGQQILRGEDVEWIREIRPK